MDRSLNDREMTLINRADKLLGQTAGVLYTNDFVNKLDVARTPIHPTQYSGP
jgi:hypothetical protein